MLTKKIKFTNYFGEEVEQEFMFNLNETELTNMNLMENGGLPRLIEKIINTRDQKRLIEYFKKIIWDSYGEISDDGMRFEKSYEKSLAFSQTDAYNRLYMELIGDAKKAADFINGIVPPEVAKAAEENQNIRKDGRVMNPALAAIQDKTIPLASAQENSTPNT